MHRPLLAFVAFVALYTAPGSGQEQLRSSEARTFSPLNQINEQTVAKLGLVWSQELGTSRGLEATPVIADGVIYTTGSWSVVFAYDARTGKLEWTWDPKVPRDRAYFVCCDVVNRGVV